LLGTLKEKINEKLHLIRLVWHGAANIKGKKAVSGTGNALKKSTFDKIWEHMFRCLSACHQQNGELAINFEGKLGRWVENQQ
jgi:hypothetical protein